MRLFPVLTATLVAAILFAMVFERDRVIAFATGGDTAGRAVAAQDAGSAPEVTAPANRATGDDATARIAVVAMRSHARQMASAVQVRGHTEVARQVSVRAETSGQVISEPLRKGTEVAADQVLCRLDPGTRQVSLLDARARLSQARSNLPAAQARLPEAEARLAEARARLHEAEINLNAATRLSKNGYASQTRLAQAKAAFESAQAAVKTASAGVASARSGVEAARAGVQSGEAAVAAAEHEISKLSIRAPFAGLLETDTAETGSLLQPGAPCATVIQLDPIKLVGFVPEAQVSRVRTGAPGGARLATGEQVRGKVTFVSRAADPRTRTFRVELQVPNPDHSIRDGQTAEILISSDAKDAHLLPMSALTFNDDGRLGVRTITDIRQSDGETTATVRFVPVTMLRDTVNGAWVAGLAKEAAVIVVGQEYVVDGVRVRVAWKEDS